MGSISIRKSIRWLPDDASEPTSTIVLTSPQRKFVDLRIFGPPPQREIPLGHIAPTQLDWGIAGTSSSSQRQEGEEGGETITRGKWDHWIDSRTTEAVSDEGDMFPLDDTTTLEKGRMVNPDTGLETDYEEVWDDVTPGVIPGVENGVRCVVLQMEDGPSRGMMVVLGRYCQAIARTDKGVSVERRIYQDRVGWNYHARLDGAWELPCDEVLSRLKLGQLPIGAAVEGAGRRWEVVEVA
ncbi:hypothetical protein NLU13_8829 [Sarocladium strictum]|uniref:Protein HRI1 n=1 Tax=Sarocladium strictum TaxID=5046 RepID=A0AA39G908_SARSR|nr:hypothetical protein NLU13_8829 [Sarocladium strictum]